MVERSRAMREVFEMLYGRPSGSPSGRQEMAQRERPKPKTYWELFHRLWTKAVGTDDYDKEQWKRLEKLMLQSPLREEKIEWE